MKTCHFKFYQKNKNQETGHDLASGQSSSHAPSLTAHCTYFQDFENLGVDAIGHMASTPKYSKSWNHH